MLYTIVVSRRFTLKVKELTGYPLCSPFSMSLGELVANCDCRSSRQRLCAENLVAFLSDVTKKAPSTPFYLYYGAGPSNMKSKLISQILCLIKKYCR